MSKRKYLFFMVLVVSTILSCSATSDYEKSFEEYLPFEVLTDDWYSIYFSDIKVGYDHIRITRGELDGIETIRVIDEGVIIFSMADVTNPTENSYRGEVYLSADTSVLGFTYEDSILGHDLEVVGLNGGDGYLYIDIYSGGGNQKLKFDVEENIYPSVAMVYLGLIEDLTPGETYDYRVFLENLKVVEDYVVEIIDEVEVEVGGVTYDALELEGSLGLYKFTSYVDHNGRLLKQVTMDSFVMLLDDMKNALDIGDSSGITMDVVIDFSLVPIDRDINNPRRLDLLKVKIKDIPRDYVPISGNFQMFTGPDDDGSYIYTIKRGDIDLLDSPDYGEFPEEVNEYLLPTVSIESDDERFVSKAKEIVGEGTDPVTDTEKIMGWVFVNLEKKLVDVTSALDALESMEGECQAHAHIFAALARAAGIPTKVVSGIVYSEYDGGFLFHSWNEVYLGEWVPVDSTFGQFPVDPTHIKFTEGEGSSVIDIMPLVGKIEMEILETGEE